MGASVLCSRSLQQHPTGEGSRRVRGDPLVLQGISTPAFNTTLTRDLDLPSALWLPLSPLDSVVGAGREDEPRVLTRFQLCQPRKRAWFRKEEVGGDHR